ncbi:hypothetical protein DIPPA_52614 [Diplonema papillatum]|nr:hypothetical protein DIPPA_52614 [Diplonema papillatum]
MKRKRLHQDEWKEKQGSGSWTESEREMEARKWAEAVRKRQRGDGAVTVSHVEEREVGPMPVRDPIRQPERGIRPQREPGRRAYDLVPEYTPRRASPPRPSASSRPHPSRLPVRPAVQPVTMKSSKPLVRGLAHPMRAAPSRLSEPPRNPSLSSHPRPAPATSRTATVVRKPPTAQERQEAVTRINRLGSSRLKLFSREQLEGLGRSLGLPAAEITRTTDFLVQKLVRTSYNLQHAQKSAPGTTDTQAEPAGPSAPKPTLVKSMITPSSTEKRWVRCPLCEQAVQVPVASGAYTCPSCSGLFAA